MALDYFCVGVAMILSVEALRIDPALVGLWIRLMARAADRENGGVLRGARDWTARDWDRLIALPRGALAKLEAAGLVAWSGSDLVVSGYDVDAEASVQAHRKQATEAAKTRWKRHAARIADGIAGRSAGSNASESDRRVTVTESDRRGSAPGAAPPALQLEPTNGNKQSTPPRGTEAIPEAVGVAEHLLAAVRSHTPDARGDVARWAGDIDKGMRRDGRTAEQLRALADFAHRRPDDVYWRGRITTGKRLIESAGTLARQMEGRGTGIARDPRVGQAPPDTVFSGGAVRL